MMNDFAPFILVAVVVAMFGYLFWFLSPRHPRVEAHGYLTEADLSTSNAAGRTRWAAFIDTMGMRVWIDADAVERVYEEPADVQVTIIHMRMDWVRVRGTCEETLATLDGAQ